MNDLERDLIQYPEAIKIIEDNNVENYIIDIRYVNPNGLKYTVVKFFGRDEPHISVFYCGRDRKEGFGIEFTKNLNFLK